MKCSFSYEVIISFDDKFYLESGMSFADDLRKPQLFFKNTIVLT